MGKTDGRRKSKTSKHTFWSDKRVENDISLEELGETIGVSYTLLGKYLTGQCYPPTSVITALCDLFSVDYDEGTAEFKKAFKGWKSSKREYKKKKLIDEDRRAVVPVRSADGGTDASVSPTDAPENVLRAVYGELGYDDFVTLQETVRGGMPTLEFLYNSKIDFDLFVKVTKLIAKEEA